jgi:hypothetical protein
MVWFFERGSERLHLAIRRNAAAYEVHVEQPDGTRSVEFVGAAKQLVEQIHAVPQALIAAGWCPRLQLEFPASFDSAETGGKS